MNEVVECEICNAEGLDAAFMFCECCGGYTCPDCWDNDLEICNDCAGDL